MRVGDGDAVPRPGDHRRVGEVVAERDDPVGIEAPLGREQREGRLLAHPGRCHLDERAAGQRRRRVVAGELGRDGEDVLEVCVRKARDQLRHRQRPRERVAGLVRVGGSRPPLGRAQRLVGRLAAEPELVLPPERDPREPLAQARARARARSPLRAACGRRRSRCRGRRAWRRWRRSRSPPMPASAASSRAPRGERAVATITSMPAARTAATAARERSETVRSERSSVPSRSIAISPGSTATPIRRTSVRRRAAPGDAAHLGARLRERHADDLGRRAAPPSPRTARQRRGRRRRRRSASRARGRTPSACRRAAGARAP